MRFPVFQDRHYNFRNGLQLKLGKKTLIMGILNVTPDSFSDGGYFETIESATLHAQKMIQEGVDIIDIGGESTRPGHCSVDVDTELARVIPVIEALRGLNIPLSIDTSKARVAKAALEAGAHLINDVWGCKYDAQMAIVAAEHACPIILMHNSQFGDYQQLIHDIRIDLQESIGIALKAGVQKENIWLDPGIGFAKTYEQNIQILQQLEQITTLGYPVLLGTSRKRFIQQTLRVSAQEAAVGTAATTGMGIMQGCQVFRVHDVQISKQVAQMTDAVVYAAY